MTEEKPTPIYYAFLNDWYSEMVYPMVALSEDALKAKVRKRLVELDAEYWNHREESIFDAEQAYTDDFYDESTDIDLETINMNLGDDMFFFHGVQDA